LRSSVPPRPPVEVLRRRIELRQRRRARRGGVVLAVTATVVIVVAGSAPDGDEGRTLVAGPGATATPSQPTTSTADVGSCAGCPKTPSQPLGSLPPVGVEVDGYLRLTQPWADAGTVYAPPGDRRPKASPAQAVEAVRKAAGAPSSVLDEPPRIALGIKTDGTRGINAGTLVYVIYRNLPDCQGFPGFPELGPIGKRPTSGSTTTTVARQTSCLLTTEVVADTAKPSGFLGIN